MSGNLAHTINDDLSAQILEIGHAATSLQSLAADPMQNIWVNASAGTGKTKVLTERVLRLLLPREAQENGTPPENILCITFTKAGANEMITRVMGVLSKWAVCSQTQLQDDLQKLLGQDATLNQLDCARRLFASVIDLPDGLNITTIHAFCQSILGRFVVEANLPPNFSVMEDSESAQLIGTVRDQLVHDILSDKTNDDLKSAFLWLSKTKATSDIQSILQSLLQQREELGAFYAAYPDYQNHLKKFLNLPHNINLNDLFAIYFSDQNFPIQNIKRLSTALHQGSEKDIAKARVIYDFCAADLIEREKLLTNYQSVFIKKNGEIFKSPMTKMVRDYDPQAMDIFIDEANRVLRYLETRNSLEIYHATCALLCIGQEMITRHKAAKTAAQKIDYDDLIHKTLTLLNGPMRDWVLYKLDYKIDHILLDEAQDTSPDQWNILKSILNDFASGESIRDDETLRTLFVVGDNKQSIFGFQGADPMAFNDTHDAIKDKFISADLPWYDVPMNTSFRSTDAILNFVDQVFETEELKNSLTQNPQNYKSHTAFRTGHAGRVDIWPLVKAPKQEKTRWELPVEIKHSHNTMSYLAQQIADQIYEWLNKKEILKSKSRPIQPGDIMILVRRRNQMVDHLVRTLNAQQIPVAGVDRLQVVSHIGVQDVLAALQFAIMPDDDLTLATLLKSPFVGWDDAVLEDYAYNRDGTLWHYIKNNAPDDVVQYLQNLIEDISAQNAFFAVSDLLNKPCPNYDLTGWQVMNGRLGEDSQDALEEMVSMAQQFDANNPGEGLQGFITQIAKNVTSIKREMEGQDDKVRIMTVHASKGLQAPIVFMPDTTSIPKRPGQSKEGLLWVQDDMPLWSPSSSVANDILAAHRDELNQTAMDEYYRLLYVAMTRAEDRLVICGTLDGNTDRVSDKSWYGVTEEAIRGMGEVKESSLNFAADYMQHDSNSEFWSFETQQLADPRQEQFNDAVIVQQPLPDWTKTSPPQDQHPPRILKPSQIHGEDMPVRSPLSSMNDEYRFRRGNLTHALLQYLPDIDVKERSDAARRYLDKQAPDISKAVRQSILNETLAVLNTPEFAQFFAEGSMAEVPISGMVTRSKGKIDIVNGQIDRMLVTDDAIWIIDFKSNRPPPKDPAKIPLQYRNQLSAYKMLIQDIYPNHIIHCALLWTDGPFITLMDNL